MPIPRDKQGAYARTARASRKCIENAMLTRLQPYLPPVPSSPSTRAENEKTGSRADAGGSTASKFVLREKTRERFRLRRFVANQLYVVVYIIVHAIFSVYRRFRIGYHGIRDRIYSVLKYHHRTPEIIARDVRDLRRLPKHLSVILQLEDNGHGLAELERLVNEVSDIAAWCASAGIPMLSVYERTGQFCGASL